MASPSKRREMDVMKLMMSDWKVELVNDSINEMYVEFKGPKDSPYDGGYWKVHVELSEAYPYKSPSIGFANRIYHPNIDEMSGSVCLDVLNSTWSPMYDLVNVFEVFLPQLLLYPNPSDPLNAEAAALSMREPEAFKNKVRDYVRKYAQPEHIGIRLEREGGGAEGGSSDGEADGSASEAFMSSDEEGEGGGSEDESDQEVAGKGEDM